jgi:uncharacterized membrane protein
MVTDSSNLNDTATINITVVRPKVPSGDYSGLIVMSSLTIIIIVVVIFIIIWYLRRRRENVEKSEQVSQGSPAVGVEKQEGPKDDKNIIDK